jgi:[ribosomal protein S5]-alanine N-acetyltransferase
MCSERICLVPVTPANADVLWDVLQEPDLRDFQDLPDVDMPQFRRSVSARPRTLEPGATGRFEWLIYFNAAKANQALGWVSLRVAEPSRSSAEIGYSVIRAYRGHGVATEAVRMLVNEGFRKANLSCIRAYCVPENRSSRAVLRRNAFEEDGTLPHGATVQGRPVDVVAHVLDRRTWESTHQRVKRASQQATTNRPAIGS